MVQNRPQPSLEELAVRAKTAAIRAKDDSHSCEVRQQALLEKQILLTELMSVLMEQIKIELPKPKSIDLSYIYEETLQNTLLYVCKNIEKFDPERITVKTINKDEPKENPFIRWFIFLFFKRKIDIIDWIKWKGKVISIYKDNNDSETNILDVYCPPEVNNPLPSEKLIAFIKEDPEGLFASTLFKNNPKASFQIILLKKGEEGKSWKEIVEELKLGKTHGPIFTFYGRCCEKFAPYFRKYLNLEVKIKRNQSQTSDASD
ncbi:hypothetical protein [Nostoc sp. 2RC]|uniref:hypothetical protein n=1 Tax=Nostoc sp. 2RC TaxID=2485484 RepID=UPI00162823FD|nr:hypothetical protein [Nostoc sp. 2RC]MBC1238062.1 hypothetical protein [Nostoc sp. 2RC]